MVVRCRVYHMFLHNRLADGGKVVSFTRRQQFTTERFLLCISIRDSKPQGYRAAGSISISSGINLSLYIIIIIPYNEVLKLIIFQTAVFWVGHPLILWTVAQFSE
jgi:hypothetical protein